MILTIDGASLLSDVVLPSVACIGVPANFSPAFVLLFSASLIKSVSRKVPTHL